jgi:hypothetical protein
MLEQGRNLTEAGDDRAGIEYELVQQPFPVA